MTESKHMRAYWIERDRLAAELHASGLSWSKVAEQMNMTREGARKSAHRHYARQAEAAE